MLEETIAAISTPPGEGGIGIIRISGEKAKDILDNIFVPVNAGSLENRKMAYGNIVNPSSKKIIDDNIFSLFSFVKSIILLILL